MQESKQKIIFRNLIFFLYFVAFSCMWVFNIVEITFIFAASAISAIKHLLNSWGLENGSIDKAHQPWGLRVAPAHKGCLAIFFPIDFICNTKYECNYNHNLSQIIETWRKVFRKLSIAFNILTHFVGLAQLGMENSFTFLKRSGSCTSGKGKWWLCKLFTFSLCVFLQPRLIKTSSNCRTFSRGIKAY